MKKCKKCSAIKPYSEFGQHRKHCYRETCNQCRASQERFRYHQNLTTSRYYARTKQKLRRQTNPNTNILSKCRTRLWRALKGKVKHSHTLTMIGCSLEQLIQHIKNQFTQGMTWDLFMSGDIHLDHIIPCSSFDLSKAEGQAKCFHYSNLQPLWAKDNLAKGRKRVMP